MDAAYGYMSCCSLRTTSSHQPSRLHQRKRRLWMRLFGSSIAPPRQARQSFPEGFFRKNKTNRGRFGQQNILQVIFWAQERASQWNPFFLVNWKLLAKNWEDGRCFVVQNWSFSGSMWVFSGVFTLSFRKPDRCYLWMISYDKQCVRV